ncbi:S24 family peptidase [Allobranchiibius sp. GilTou38]|uniref:S24 family peptidase n=1 Tax=Allobranchiibius sp. GilTou38 TaxID=2815210 RepID=UPI001AA1AF4F|nr:S24 family peptidase [Allobranchiibius sp. GilTou38]MBO1767540.1 peptidase S24 [Allobranchiibius sp. GilTou38]
MRGLPRIGVAVVRGRSMEPTYAEGDRLLVAYGVRPAPGRAHVIRLPDGPDGPRPIAVKWLTRREGDGWWAERDNPAEGIDSWLVGAIPEHDVLARVLLRLPRSLRAR